MSKADAKIYLAAAKLMAETTEPGENEFSCNCIQRVAGNSITRKRYEEVFGKMLFYCDEKKYLLIRDVELAAGGYSSSQRCRDFRVLMLCMMAAIVEEDDDLG